MLVKRVLQCPLGVEKCDLMQLKRNAIVCCNSVSRAVEQPGAEVGQAVIGARVYQGGEDDDHVFLDEVDLVLARIVHTVVIQLQQTRNPPSIRPNGPEVIVANERLFRLFRTFFGTLRGCFDLIKDGRNQLFCIVV